MKLSRRISMGPPSSKDVRFTVNSGVVKRERGLDGFKYEGSDHDRREQTGKSNKQG